MLIVRVGYFNTLMLIMRVGYLNRVVSRVGWGGSLLMRPYNYCFIIDEDEGRRAGQSEFEINTQKAKGFLN
eukprot:310652-Hanusia_phi.AAC.1